MRAALTPGFYREFLPTCPTATAPWISARETVVFFENCSLPVSRTLPASNRRSRRSRRPSRAIRPLIRHDVFREDTFASESLSLITCFQTIEHLSDPLSFCQAARQALKPGGALFLIGHNRRALSAKVLRRKSPIFDIEHLQLFSPESIHHLLERAGFSRVEVMTVFNRYPLQYWARLFPFPAGSKQRILKVLQSIPTGRWVIPLPAGNLAAIAHK